MKNVLLCSPDFVRTNSNISDNLNSKVLSTAIRAVQEDELQEIIGQNLLEKIQDLISDNTIYTEENEIYKEVLDKCQMFIVYKVIAEVIVLVNCKIDNAGLVQTRDENMEYMDLSDTFTLKNYYDSKASHYAYLLQNFLLKNMKDLPELTKFQSFKIYSTLYSAGSPSIFLGGNRGKGACKVYPYRFQYGMNFK